MVLTFLILDIFKEVSYFPIIMKAKFLFLSSVSVLSALSAYAADTFFFLAPSSGSNVNDMSLWKQLSTYKGGDTFNFYIFPEGADDKIPGDVPDSGKWAAGAISSDQSKTVTADSDVIINRYCLGELQPDGSVTFGSVILGDTQSVVFTDSFTARNMQIRINNRVDMNFAPSSEAINLNLSGLSIYQVAHAYIKKTAAGEVNINVDGDFSFGSPTAQVGCNLDVGAYDGFIDSVRANNFKLPNALDLTITFYAYRVDFASTDIRNTYNNAEKGEGNTRLVLNVGRLDPSSSEAVYSLGTAYKNADDAITVDFGMVDPENLSAGEYKIVSVDEWSEGFAESGLSDFDLRTDVLDAYGIEYGIGWDGQTLTLAVVPEPAAFAAALGLFALSAAAWRGRRGNFK